jgi:hypothetical protein
MSRGLGTRQRRLLVSLAAIAEGRAQGASPGKEPSGASVFEVLTLWSRLDGLPRQAFDRANLLYAPVCVLPRARRPPSGGGRVSAVLHAPAPLPPVSAPAAAAPPVADRPDASRRAARQRRRQGPAGEAVARPPARAAAGARPPGPWVSDDEKPTRYAFGRHLGSPGHGVAAAPTSGIQGDASTTRRSTEPNH